MRSLRLLALLILLLPSCSREPSSAPSTKAAALVVGPGTGDTIWLDKKSFLCKRVPTCTPKDTIHLDSGSILAGYDAPLDTAPPLPPPLPFAPEPPPPLRVVNVKTQSALLSAAYGARAGDEIRLAPGTYTGGVQLSIGKGGTAVAPLVFRCEPGAVIDRGGKAIGYGFRIRGPYVQLRGCVVRNAQFLVSVERGSGGPNPTDAVLSDLVLRDGNQNAVVLWAAHRAVIQRSTISHIGGAGYVEGIYGGHSRDPSLMSHDVKILGNHLGPGILGEHIDMKGLSGGRSARGLIAGNVADAIGTPYRSAAPTVAGVYSDQGCSRCRWEGNTVKNLSPSLNGFFFFTAQGAVVRGNTSSAASGGGYGYRELDRSSNGSETTFDVFSCDNVGTKNVSCAD